MNIFFDKFDIELMKKRKFVIYKHKHIIFQYIN